MFRLFDQSGRVPRLPRPVAYGLAAAVLAFELIVFVWMLNPTAGENYRAFYIDRTSTCLPQPVSGTYALGHRLSFKWPEREEAKPVKPCGWFESNGDGTPTKGESAMLRFDIAPQTEALEFTLVATPVDKAGVVLAQRVVVEVADVVVGQFTIEAPAQANTVTIPPDIAARAGRPLDLTLQLLDAVSFDHTGGGSNTQFRALVVQMVRLARAAPPVGNEASVQVWSDAPFSSSSKVTATSPLAESRTLLPSISTTKSPEM